VHTNDYLNAAAISDYCLNGLQGRLLEAISAAEFA